MGGRSYGAEEKAKLERLITEGSTVLREIDDLQGLERNSTGSGRRIASQSQCYQSSNQDCTQRRLEHLQPRLGRN